MTHRRIFTLSWGLGICLFITLFRTEAVRAQDLTIDAQLIWGTNDERSSDPRHRPVEAALARRLERTLGHRWRNFFQINQAIVTVAPGDMKIVTMSKICRLEIRNLGADRSEIKLYGRGRPVSRHVETLSGNHLIILGGDAENETAWLVVLRRVVVVPLGSLKLQVPSLLNGV